MARCTIAVLILIFTACTSDTTATPESEGVPQEPTTTVDLLAEFCATAREQAIFRIEHRENTVSEDDRTVDYLETELDFDRRLLPVAPIRIAPSVARVIDAIEAELAARVEKGAPLNDVEVFVAWGEAFNNDFRVVAQFRDDVCGFTERTLRAELGLAAEVSPVADGLTETQYASLDAGARGLLDGSKELVGVRSICDLLLSWTARQQIYSVTSELNPSESARLLYEGFLEDAENAATNTPPVTEAALGRIVDYWAAFVAKGESVAWDVEALADRSDISVPEPTPAELSQIDSAIAAICP